LTDLFQKYKIGCPDVFVANCALFSSYYTTICVCEV